METLRVSPVPSLGSTGGIQDSFDRMNDHGDPSRHPNPSYISYGHFEPDHLLFDFGLDELTGDADSTREPSLHRPSSRFDGHTPNGMWDTLQQPDFQRPVRWDRGPPRPVGQYWGQPQSRQMIMTQHTPFTSQEHVQSASSSAAQEQAPAWTVPDLFDNGTYIESVADWDPLLMPTNFGGPSALQQPWTSMSPHSDQRNIPELEAFEPTMNVMNYAASGDSSPQFGNMHTPSTLDSPLFPHAQPDYETIDSLRASVGASSENSRFNTVPSHHDTYVWQQNMFDNRTFSRTSLPSTASFEHAPSVSDECTSPSSEFVFVNHSDFEGANSPTVTHIKEEPTSSPIREHPSAGLPSSASSSSSSMFMNTFPIQEDIKDINTKDLAIRRGSQKRAGGRAVGMHLTADKAARAKQLREEGVCWLCCFQRDSCTPGEVCDRCTKRSHRSQMEHGLGCDRTKLTELKTYFIPDFVARDYNSTFITDTFKSRINRWCGIKIKLKVYLVWSAPPIECDLYEYEPRSQDMLRQLQWYTNKNTGRRERVDKASPPLAMVEIGQNERRMFEKYINSIVDQGLEKFAERCFKSPADVDDFQARLLRMMIRLKPDSKEEAALLRENFRLMVIVYVMSRVATLSPSERPLLSKLRSYAGHPEAYDRITSPYMVDQQIKYIFHQLMVLSLDTVLKRLNQIFRSSKGGTRWTSAFCSMLALAMNFEMIQRWVHCWQDGCYVRKKVTKQDSECNAEAACRVIDDKFQFMCLLFRWKYHKGFNPLKDWQKDKVRQTLGEDAWEFIRGVTNLVVEKKDFLDARHLVNVAASNQDQYTSRLVGRFLLSFWSAT